VVFVLFTAVTRVDIVPAIPPDELRYSWAIAAYVVLAALCAARSRPSLVPDPPPALGLVVASVAGVILLAGLVVLVGDLRDWNTKVATARPGLSTVLYATEAIGADRVDPDVVIPLSYIPVTTGGYLDAVAAVGSPIADIDATGLGGAELDRGFADTLLVEQLPIVLEPTASDDAACTTPLGPDGAGRITVPAGSRLALRGEGDVAVARFADGQPQPLGTVQGDAELLLPADAASVATKSIVEGWPYRVSVPDGVDVFACD
jgi:hypothetical protein